MDAKRSYETDVAEKVRDLEATFDSLTLGTVNNLPIFCLDSRGALDLPQVYIQAGIHGNEPAGVYAVLDFLKDTVEEFKALFHFYIVPCANPSGFELDTRKNKNEIDLNRDFLSEKPQEETKALQSFFQDKQFLAVLDLHEDPSDEPAAEHEESLIPTSFYMYEKTPDPADVLAKSIIEKLEASGFEIWKESNEVYGERIQEGIIRQQNTGVESAEWGTFDEYINTNTKYLLIPETPTCWDLTKRIEAHKLFLATALNELKNKL